MLNSNQMGSNQQQSGTNSEMLKLLRKPLSTHTPTSRQEAIKQIELEIAHVQTLEGKEALELVGVNPREFLALLYETRNYLLG
ncbi:hypothetical protein ACN4EG_08160 [Alkalinema pantanalense CENA528]|uniref:hypothetical protein n=1 Tax=Alkalinema pantanalense TaxID=1620705 RepID=UPI003D6E9A71